MVLKGHRTLVVQARWRSVGQYDGQSWHGDWRHGRHSDGDGCGHDGTAFRNAFVAVLAAVHLHGLAGDVMRETVGEYSLVAADLLQGLPEAFRRTREAAREKLVTLVSEFRARLNCPSGHSLRLVNSCHVFDVGDVRSSKTRVQSWNPAICFRNLLPIPRA